MEKDWSDLAENFDALQRYITGAETDKRIKQALSQLGALGHVLELGCGNGNYTRVLLANSQSILATDISASMVEVAKRQLADLTDITANITVQTADCYATGLPENQFDTVFMGNVIHVVKYPNKALQEAQRVLKAGGRLIIVSFTMDGMRLINKIKMIYRYLKAFGKPAKEGTPFKLETLTDFLKQQGFQIETATLIGDRQSKAMLIVATV